MHTDKFGREWLYTPGHDADRMLRPSKTHTLAALNFERAMRGAPTVGQDYMDGLEPYLLKMGNAWVFGARFGDEGHQYYSPGLDQRVIEMMLQAHVATSTGEFRAMEALQS